MPRSLVVLAAAASALACATTSPSSAAGQGSAVEGMTGLGPSDVTGGMVQHLRGTNTQVLRAGAFGPESVAGAAGSAHTVRLDRTAAGTWTGGAGLVSGSRFPDRLDVTLALVDGRITGPSVDVRYTKMQDGLRLEGLWFGGNVSLEINPRYAQVQGDRWNRDSAGNYVSPDGSTMEFLGDARRLEAPTMPQMALMLLLFEWGVR